MRSILKRVAARLHAIEDHLTVRAQIAAVVGVICVVLVGILTAGAALISYRNTAALEENRLAGIAAATSGRLDRFMATRQQERELFAELQPMQGLWHGDADGLRRSLEALQHSFTEFAWIGFADTDGTVVAGTGGLLQGASVAARPWFKEGLHNLAVGDVHEALLLSSLLVPRTNGEPYRFVDLAVPVHDRGDKLVGVLGGHLNWDWATNLIADAEARAGSGDTKLSIVSKTGVVLVGPQKDQTRFSGEELAGMVAAHDGSFMETAAGQRILTAFHVGTGHNEYQGLNWI